MMFQHHINDPTDDPGPNVIDLDPEDLTNVRSPSLEVLAVTDLQDEPVVRLDHDPRQEEESPRREDQAGLCRSLFGQLPHDIEKDDIEIKMTTNHRNQLTHTSHSSTCNVGKPPATVILQHQHSIQLLPLRPTHHQQVAIQRTMERLLQVL